jgi:hypothetical protein
VSIYTPDLAPFPLSRVLFASFLSRNIFTQLGILWRLPLVPETELSGREFKDERDLGTVLNTMEVSRAKEKETQNES